MKTLNDVKQDMSTLYDELRKGTVELKHAAELANIAGKFLKAEQLELAKEVFGAARAPAFTKPVLQGPVVTIETNH